MGETVADHIGLESPVAIDGFDGLTTGGFGGLTTGGFDRLTVDEVTIFGGGRFVVVVAPPLAKGSA